MAETSDPPPRQEFQFALTTTDRGKITLKMYDRITIDDVYLHLINREVFRILTGEDADVEVDPFFKQFLLGERFTVGQN